MLASGQIQIVICWNEIMMYEDAGDCCRYAACC